MTSASGQARGAARSPKGAQTTLAAADLDVPFSLFYLVGDDGAQAPAGRARGVDAGAAGARHRHLRAPFGDLAAPRAWPLAEVIAGARRCRSMI